MIALYQKAEELFGGLESFNRCLRKPAEGLGNRVPMPFLQTSRGIDLIREEANVLINPNHPECKEVIYQKSGISGLRRGCDLLIVFLNQQENPISGKNRELRR